MSEETKDLEPKHPLQNEWDLWYFKPDKSKDWAENLMLVTSFDSVEDFWALYNHIELASNLHTGSDYSFFKKGIKPMWEDPRNREGGRWLFQFPKRTVNAKSLDEVWLEVLLCLIGEGCGEESDQICGAVLNVRPKADKISVWTSDKNSEAVIKIGRTLKERMGYFQTAHYEAHQDTQVRHGSTARHIYSV